MPSAGSAYLVQPDSGPGPGVLVLHSWWGLTPGVRRVVERLADAGYTAMAPDLLAGVVPEDRAEAQRELAESDPNVTADLVLSSPVTLRAYSADPQAPIAVIGYSMGASWALWLATRLPDDVAAAVMFYGTQNIDFERLQAPVLAHFAEMDELVAEDERTEMHARLLLSERSIEVHDYPGTQHWFAEEDQLDRYDEDAAELAWERTMEFIDPLLGSSGGADAGSEQI